MSKKIIITGEVSELQFTGRFTDGTNAKSMTDLLSINAQNKIVIESSSDITIGGVSVPSMTVEQVESAYNNIVAGNIVVVSSNDGTKHFVPVVADSLSDMPSIQFVYYNLIITYWVENNTVHNSFVSVGGGTKKYAHFVSDSNTNRPYKILIICERSEPFDGLSLSQWLFDNGYNSQDNSFKSILCGSPTNTNPLDFITGIYSSNRQSNYMYYTYNRFTFTISNNAINISLTSGATNNGGSINDYVIPLS